MGLEPGALADVVAAEPSAPIAIGANCGVGASDLLVSVLSMTEAAPNRIIIAKANCGIPEVKGDQVVYSGTPDLMARFVSLAVDAGARIIGGCCGTSPNHVAAMREALDRHNKGPRPSRAQIEQDIGPLVNPPIKAGTVPRRRSRRSRA